MSPGTGVTIAATVASVGLVMVDVAFGIRDGVIQLVTIASGLFCVVVGGLAAILVARHGTRRPGRA